MPYIIVPLDGSDLARRAIPVAVALARATGCNLKLVQAAVSPASLDVANAVEMIVEGAEESLREEAAAIRRTYGLAVVTRVALAFPDRLILEKAGNRDATAIVMSTHGRTGLLRLARGSVAEAVLRRSPVPVYLVPAGAGLRSEYPSLRHILVPLDGSDLAYSVTAPAANLARKTGAEITLLRVFQTELPEGQPLTDLIHHNRLEYQALEYFSPIKAHMRNAGAMVTSQWSLGQPAEQILATADEVGADLIALATHGRSGLDRVRYGSVAEEVLRHSKHTMMTLGPEAIRRLKGSVSTAVDHRTAEPVVV
jgi:nucleotide-binding universal stress UspA family protein